jgi:hypothetical protein
MVNNGITATYADGGQVSATYTSLDIPLLFHYNFILSPVLVRVFAGPYLAIPVGKMNMEVSGLSGGTSAETKGVTGGVTGEELRTTELCRAAIQQNGEALEDVPKELRTAKLCLEAPDRL